MRVQLTALIAMGLVPEEGLARLLVIAEAEHVSLAVAARLPGARLPVGLIVIAPDAALTPVATAAALLSVRVSCREEATYGAAP